MKTAEEILKEYGNWNKEGLAEWHKDCIIAAMEEYAQQQVKNLNIPAVIKPVCDDCTAYLFDERGKTPLCKTCKDNSSQTVL